MKKILIAMIILFANTGCVSTSFVVPSKSAIEEGDIKSGMISPREQLGYALKKPFTKEHRDKMLTNIDAAMKVYTDTYYRLNKIFKEEYPKQYSNWIDHDRESFFNPKTILPKHEMNNLKYMGYTLRDGTVRPYTRISQAAKDYTDIIRKISYSNKKYKSMYSQFIEASAPARNQSSSSDHKYGKIYFMRGESKHRRDPTNYYIDGERKAVLGENISYTEVEVKTGKYKVSADLIRARVRGTPKVKIGSFWVDIKENQDYYIEYKSAVEDTGHDGSVIYQSSRAIYSYLELLSPSIGVNKVKSYKYTPKK